MARKESSLGAGDVHRLSTRDVAIVLLHLHHWLAVGRTQTPVCAMRAMVERALLAIVVDVRTVGFG